MTSIALHFLKNLLKIWEKLFSVVNRRNVPIGFDEWNNVKLNNMSKMCLVFFCVSTWRKLNWKCRIIFMLPGRTKTWVKSFVNLIYKKESEKFPTIMIMICYKLLIICLREWRWKGKNVLYKIFQWEKTFLFWMTPKRLQRKRCWDLLIDSYLTLHFIPNVFRECFITCRHQIFSWKRTRKGKRFIE